MNKFEPKYIALLSEVERRGLPDMSSIRLCFQTLSLVAAIDRDCVGRLAPHQLSEGKFVLLFLLHERAEGLSPHELAWRSGVTRATITGLVDGLERDGFVMRHAGLQDRRKVAVRLTLKGQEVARDMFTQHAAWISSLFAGLSDEERGVFSRLLTRVWHNTDAAKVDTTVPQLPKEAG